MATSVLLLGAYLAAMVPTCGALTGTSRRSMQIKPNGHTIAHEHLRKSAAQIQFREHFSRFGRMPARVVPGDFFLDYEVQFGRLHITPDVLLDSVYSKAFKHRSCASRLGPAFRNVSAWFTLGTDGGSRARQQFNVQLEATSARMMNPKDVLESSFLRDIQELVDGTNHAGAKIPGTNDRVTMRKGTKTILMQYTVGLHLSQVPLLMVNSSAKDIWEKTEARCKNKPVLYKALVSLAAMTVHGVAGHNAHKGKYGAKCTHAKRYLLPWLVRTHFGDLVKYVASKVDSQTLQALPKDVLAVSQVHRNDKAFPAGVIDYLHMLEIAEVAKLSPRVTLNKQPSPHKLCELASSAINHISFVRKSVRRLGCGVYGFNATAAGLLESNLQDHKQVLSAIASPKKWLEAMLEGHDLWTDRESRASQNSKSNLIFKSMGSWRMDTGSGEGYVYLESEHDLHDQGALHVRNPKSPVSEQMRQVAEIVADLQKASTIYR